MRQQYVVTGMTCQHCVHHVTEEVGAVAGVTGVEVSLDGSMVVTSEGPIDFRLIQEAVAEAGNYSVSLP